MSTTATEPIPSVLDDNGIPRYLGELLELQRCCHCHDLISKYEMVAIWLAGDYVAHLHCWAQAHNVITNREATS